MSKDIKIIFVLSIAAMAFYAIFISNFGKIDTRQNMNASEKYPITNASHQKEGLVFPEKGIGVAAPEIEAKSVLVPPLSSASERATKKLFGMKVSPGNSPVNPERFSGYHSGVDFEILSGEENADVPVSAVCTGPLLEKRIVSGYGGVAIQKCSIENAAVTVIYGHLRLSSVEKFVGNEISAGGKIGILGKGYSAEVSGERKHLHLGIHKGSGINYLGYVQSEGELSDWIDVMKYLK